MNSIFGNTALPLDMIGVPLVFLLIPEPGIT